MEKTLKYQLNESYAEGYRDAKEEIWQSLKQLCSCDSKYLCIACRTTLHLKGEEI